MTNLQGGGFRPALLSTWYTTLASLKMSSCWTLPSTPAVLAITKLLHRWGVLQHHALSSTFFDVRASAEFTLY